MPLPSFLQRFFQGAAGRRPGAEPVSVSAADVEAVRVRARRRLIGMAVLVGAGVIGFPWLFETKPRPMAMDIEVVQRGASAAVVSTAAPKPGVQAQVKSVQESHPDEQEEVLDDKPVTKPAAHTAAASKAPESRVAEGKKPEKILLGYKAYGELMNDRSFFEEVAGSAMDPNKRKYKNIKIKVTQDEYQFNVKCQK